jgi:chromosome segregation ATPase
MQNEDATIDSSTEGLTEELERLRALVGPLESSYHDLVGQVAAAQQVAKTAEQDAGALRAELTELKVDLRRARQDQRRVQRAVLWPVRAVRRVLRRALSR